MSTTTFTGTYDGVSGRFTCDGDCKSACGNATNTDTGLMVTEDWTFTPGSGSLSSLNAGVRQDHDQEFLYFGIWYSEPDVASKAHDFAVIHGGGIEGGTDLGMFSAYIGQLAGQAHFRGGAIGKYVTRNQVNQVDKIGTFTGEATFTANFGDEDDTTAEISGRISNLRESGNALSGWWVHLASGTRTEPSADPVDIIAAAAAGATSASIGGVTATGNWGATFYGRDNAPHTEFTDDEDYPEDFPAVDLAGLAGWFDASDAADAGDGHVAIAGAFAATPNN